MSSLKTKTTGRIIITFIVIAIMALWVSARDERYFDVINGTHRYANSVAGINIPFPWLDQDTEFTQLLAKAEMLEPASFQKVYSKPFYPWAIFASTMQPKAKIAQVTFIKYVSGIESEKFTFNREHIEYLRALARSGKYFEMENYVDELYTPDNE